MKENKPTNALYEGTVDLAGYKLSCAVLNDEENTRVLSKTAIVRALGKSEGGSNRGLAKMPRFISAKNLSPYVSMDLEKAILEPMKYVTVGGSLAHGIPAKYLPEICDIWLKAKDDKVLLPSQEETAKQANLLIRGLAHVGIIALVDEATGFQEVRTRKALQEILEKFIAKELRPWVKTFPDEFYENYFRLRGWQYKPLTIKRPSVVGRDTNDIIYDRLAPGVRLELVKQTPKDEKGRFKYHLHRRLTEDIGHPKLREHIASVITLMKATSTWNGFIRLLERAMPKYGETYQIPFNEDE